MTAFNLEQEIAKETAKALDRNAAEPFLCEQIEKLEKDRERLIGALRGLHDKLRFAEWGTDADGADLMSELVREEEPKLRALLAELEGK